MELHRLLSPDDGNDAMRTDERHWTRAKMDLSRVLSAAGEGSNQGDKGDDVGHCSPHAMAVQPALVAPAKAKKMGPPRPRKADILASLRAQKEALEVAMAVWSQLFGKPVNKALDATPWHDGSQEETALPAEGELERMREFLRRAVPLYKLGQEQLAVREELLRLLKPYYAYHASMRKLTYGSGSGQWEDRSQRWEAMGDLFYKPLTYRECSSKRAQVLQFIHKYESPIESDARNNDAFGWLQARKLVQDECSVHVMCRKESGEGDFLVIYDNYWGVVNDREKSLKMNFGPNTDYFHRVIQRIGDDMFVMHTVERYPGHRELFFGLQLVFRVRSGDKCIVVTCAVDSPDLQRVMRMDDTHRSSNIYWTTFEPLTRNEEGTCIEFTSSMNGFLRADHPAYAQWWGASMPLTLARSDTILQPEVPSGFQLPLSG